MKGESRFGDLGKAAAFYGFSRVQFMRMRAIGKAASDPMPVDRPEKMPEWFDRMQSKGKRRRKCPEAILARAAEAAKRTKAETKKATAPKLTRSAPKGKARTKSVAKPVLIASPPPPVPMVLGAEIGSDDMLGYEKQLLGAWNARYIAYVKSGEESSPAGRLASDGREKCLKRIMDLTKNFRHFRENDDYLRTGEVKAAAIEFANGIYLLLRRELPALFKPHEHERVLGLMDVLADRMPGMLAQSFPG